MSSLTRPFIPAKRLSWPFPQSKATSTCESCKCGATARRVDVSHDTCSATSVRTDSLGPELVTLFTLRKHHKGSPIRRVCFSDDSLMFTAAKTVKVHDLDTGKTIRKIETPSSGARIYSLCVVDRYLVAAGDDAGTFRLWDYRVDRGSAMEAKDFEDYISDLDVETGKRLVLASSGDGTVAAFNVRAKRLEPPQSEVFEAGFNCIRSLDSRGKVIAGSDDGVVSIFNSNELGNISDRFPVDSSISIERLQLVSGSRVAAGCSDGTTRLLSILPNKVEQILFAHETPVESVAVQSSSGTLASLDSNVLKVAHFEEEEEEEDDSSGASEDDKEAATKSKDEFFSDL